mmetsp:Transcript_30807/g.88513  ORF Transcript_30807/g.88513 Transcript_30807/m.88513 type:complete len:205 (-) Transcript_30807:34-648(-)
MPRLPQTRGQPQMHSADCAATAPGQPQMHSADWAATAPPVSHSSRASGLQGHRLSPSVQFATRQVMHEVAPPPKIEHPRNWRQSFQRPAIPNRLQPSTGDFDAHHQRGQRPERSRGELRKAPGKWQAIASVCLTQRANPCTASTSMANGPPPHPPRRSAGVPPADPCRCGARAVVRTPHAEPVVPLERRPAAGPLQETVSGQWA